MYRFFIISLTHIKAHCLALLLLIKNSISLGECIRKISEIMGTKPKIKIKEPRFGDLYYFVCDYKKAHGDFNWEPKIKPDEGLPKLINWINENKEIL